MRTLCFDIENVLLRRVNILDEDELQELSETKDTQYHEYVIINLIDEG